MSDAFVCPYFTGAQFELEITSETSTASKTRARATVLHAYEPFTVSPVLKVKLDTSSMAPHDTSLPDTMILKLYDRRFANDLRVFHDLPAPTLVSENQYRSLASNGAFKRSLAEWEAKRREEDERDEDYPPMEVEAYLAALLSSYHDNEVQVYKRLAPLQGNAIPRFLGRVCFLDNTTQPLAINIDTSVLGILLEFIPGEKLSDISMPTLSDEICRACVDIVNTCGDAGVLNRDVRLENFILTTSHSSAFVVPSIMRSRPLVMIDFAQCRLRREDEDDQQWKQEKWSTDEEGAVGYALQKKFGWDYKPSWKYLVIADDV